VRQITLLTHCYRLAVIIRREYEDPVKAKLITALATHRAPDRAFTRQELVERAFGYNYEGLERTIDAHIMNLRRKVERDRHPSLILTVYGVGYKFSGGHE
jgi:DNA-binding response OmpR family regulator